MREFLKGLDLDKETVDTIMVEYGKNVQGLKEEKENLTKTVNTYKTEIDNLKENLKDNDDWKSKFEELDAKVKQQEADQKVKKEKSIREERTNAFFNEVKFASESAKAGVIAQFNEKDFKYDEESQKFQGASEWLEELKKNDTGAFVSEVANPKYTTTPTAPTSDSSMDELKEAFGLPNEQK